MKQIFALLSGLVFGIGLIVSGMADPAKVLNFLDVFGTWDPSLAFVMGGAIAVTAPGFAWLFRSRQTPYFDSTFRVPTRNDLEPKLLTGAAIFGVGWGLGGFCPGPALTALPLAARTLRLLHHRWQLRRPRFSRRWDVLTPRTQASM